MINNERLVKKIFLWERLLCKNNWCEEIISICEEVESLSSFENNTSVNLKLAKEKFIEMSVENGKERWKLFQSCVLICLKIVML